MNDLKSAIPYQSICPFRIDCYPKVTSGTLFIQAQEIIHYDRLVGLAAGAGPSPTIFPQMIAVY
jgi:hypothetical protein